jgi:hypothetical protein
MTHTHIRAPKADPAPDRYALLKLIAGVVAAIALICVGLWHWDGVIDNSFSVANGQLLDTRITVQGLKDSLYGGRILYRIEAHVKYEFQGQPQDRWLPATGSTSDRAWLELELLRKPKKCLVYWKPDFPENARCRLE